MINELFKLAESMSSAGISPYEWHGSLKEIRKVTPKAPFYKISISENSSVGSIDEITNKELISKLRTWQPGANGFSFPIFNMPSLFSFTEEQVQLKKDWALGKTPFDLSLFKSWCAEKADNWDNNAKTKLEKCLHAVPEQLKLTISKENEVEKNPIFVLINLLSKLNLKDFRNNIENYIFSEFEKQEKTKELLDFIFSTTQSNDVQVVLDLYDWVLFDRPVAHEKTVEWLNSVLNKSDQVMFLQSKELDAFGCTYVELNEKMDVVKLAGAVGEVKLRSMFHDHQCQFRYGLIDDVSYPINKVNRGKIKAALEWLKEPDKEGKTWGMVDNSEILFAYPSVIPKLPIRLASFMGTKGDSPERFSSIAEDVIETLKGMPPKTKIENVQIFAIRKMDKARSKIVYFRNHTTERIIQSAQTWRDGCSNIPPISFYVWPTKTNNEEKAKPEKISPEIPMPLQIAGIINKTWKMDGKSAGELEMVKYYQGLELLLEQNRYDLAVYLLNTLLLNTYGLVVYLGNLLHSGRVIQDKKISRENYYFLPSLIGILLYSQNRFKEEYMEDIPYLIGQMLKISDELHALYCKVVRDDNVPLQLAGNSLMVSALEMPERTLAQLGQRMNPYIAWAKQYRTRNCEIKGKESWRAAWYLGLYERNASLFRDKLETLRNTRFGDREKAELFIGYLADFPKKEE